MHSVRVRTPAQIAPVATSSTDPRSPPPTTHQPISLPAARRTIEEFRLELFLLFLLLLFVVLQPRPEAHLT